VKFCCILYRSFRFKVILKGRKEVHTNDNAELILILVNLLIEEKLKNKERENDKDKVN